MRGVKKFIKKHGYILLISIIILITAINTVTAIEDNNISHTDNMEIQTITTQQNNSIQYQNNTNTQYDKNNKHKSIKQENQYYQINENNKENYQYYEFEENTQILINGTVNEFNIEINKQNISITGVNNAKLVNSIINVYDQGCIHLSNITFENDDKCESTIDIYLETDNNILENLTFNEYRQEIHDDLYRVIDVYGNNNTIRQSEFTVTYPAMHKDWMYYGDDCKGDVISIHGDNNTIEDNSFEVYEGQPKEYPFGLTRTLSIYGNKNLINRNNIYMNGTLYLYAITIFYHENIITNNIMIVNSIRYASGIAINGESSYNTIKNNTIILTTQNESYELFGLVDAAYAIVLTENEYHGGSYNIIKSQMTGNVIEDNNIMGYSNHMYGFEQFGGKETIIRNNNIDIEGRAPMGIAVIGSDTQIEDNTINVHGHTNQSEDSLDYLKPQTTGIYLFYGNNATITGNQITTDHGTAIRTLLESTTKITDNYMQVDNNIVTIDVQNPRGITDIIGNIITDIENKIINGKNIYMQDNHDPYYQENPTDNPTDNNTTNNTEPINDETTTNTTDTNLNNTNQTQDNNETENPTTNDNNQTQNTTIPEEYNQTQNITIPEEINKTQNDTKPPKNNTTENTTRPIENNQTENNTIPDENNQTENTIIPEEINKTQNITLPEELNQTEYNTPPEEHEQTDNITLSEENNQTENITVPIENTNQSIPTIIDEETEENISDTPVIENNTKEQIIEENTSINNNTNKTIQNPDTNKTTNDEHKQQNNTDIKTSTNTNQIKTENKTINQTTQATIIIDDMNNTLNNTTIENQTTPQENHTIRITDNIEEINQTINMHNSTHRTNQTISAGDTYEINSPTDPVKAQTQINKNDKPSLESDNSDNMNTEKDNSQDSTTDTIDEINIKSPIINDRYTSHADNYPNEIQVMEALPDSRKVYELNPKDIMKFLDENIYAEIAFLVIMFLALLYGYISRKKIY